MSDVEARREARRKRILENSERRLLRITGRDEATEAETKSAGPCRSSRSLLFSMDAQENQSGRGVHDATTDHRDEGGHATASRSLSGLYDSRDEVPATSDSFGKDDTNSRAEGARTTSHRWLRSDDRRSTYDEMNSGRRGGDDVPNTHSSNFSQIFFPSTLLSNRVNYVLLATLVNAMLIMRMDHLFGKTIAVPYFTMMLARMLICSDHKETTDGSLLVAALILCNVKPGVTYRLKRLMAMINIVLGDSAIYIFSFTLIHCGLSYCLPDTNSQTTSDTIEREL